jgi:hypothetical protein
MILEDQEKREDMMRTGILLSAHSPKIKSSFNMTLKSTMDTTSSRRILDMNGPSDSIFALV